MQAQHRTDAKQPESLAYAEDMARTSTKSRPAMGAHLARLRKEAGLSQVELATLIGELQQNVAYWEVNDKPPRSDVLLNMAEVLGVRVEDLLAPHAEIQRQRPAGKVRRTFEEVSKLPRSQQEKIMEMVSALVAQYRRENA